MSTGVEVFVVVVQLVNVLSVPVGVEVDVLILRGVGVVHLVEIHDLSLNGVPVSAYCLCDRG